MSNEHISVFVVTCSPAKESKESDKVHSATYNYVYPLVDLFKFPTGAVIYSLTAVKMAARCEALIAAQETDEALADLVKEAKSSSGAPKPNMECYLREGVLFRH